MNKSASIKSLSEAMVKAQAEMPHVPMNSVNPFLRNKFADLGSVIQTLKPVLQKYGLSFSQLPYAETGKVGVTTLIMHNSGEWIESDVSIDLTDEKGKSAAQVAGSIITYLRRYSLTSGFGLFADEDTDGSAPAKSDKPAEKKIENGNGDEILTDAIWTAWMDLVHRADAVRVPHKTFDRSKVKASLLKETARELREIVDNAEAQAKAGN